MGDAQELVKAAHDVRRGPAGADVLGTGQAFFEETIQVGAGLALLLP